MRSGETPVFRSCEGLPKVVILSEAQRSRRTRHAARLRHTARNLSLNFQSPTTNRVPGAPFMTMT